MRANKGREKVSKRILYFDALTIVSCLAVVFLHCNGLVHSFEPTTQWNQALAVEVLAYWAVPIFFMLTGANNMKYRAKYDMKTFLIRRIKKLVIPFLTWSIIVYFIQGLRAVGTEPFSLCDFLTRFANGTIEPIYWFFPAIISLTLAMPVLSLLTEHKATIWYIIVVSFILMFVTPPLCDIAGVPWMSSLNLPVAGGYVTYALLGYALANYPVQKKYRYVIYLAGIACLILRYAYTFHESYLAGSTCRTLFGYTYFTGLFPAMAVFLLFQNARIPHFVEKRSSTITMLSGSCFGVYLIHKLILDYFVIGFLGLNLASGIVRLICPVFIFIAASAITLALKRIPILRNIVP